MAPSNCQTHWVFLRGLVREAAHWDDFPDRFVKAIPGSRVNLIDLPGNGKHWRLRSPDTIAAMMEFARREALSSAPTSSGPAAPRFLFAISLGAMVALEWLNRHPAELAGAVLVNTSLRSLSPFYSRLAWRAWPSVLKIACQRSTRDRERAILELTSHLGAGRPELLDAREQAYRLHPIGRINFIHQLWAAASYRPPPSCPVAPLLLLNSRGDRLVNPVCSEVIARFWHVPTETHPWAGHDIPLDDPEWVTGKVREWLQIVTNQSKAR